jgi:UDP-2,4-diacetamido-2,4,6-trideoxy-beta-L-altropyranose hydrolase
MGIGHIMRCLTLAECLRERGGEVQFVCGDHPGNMAELLRQRAMKVALLPRTRAAEAAVADADYGEWLGATQSQDAEQTARALRGMHVDWLIVDHYALGADWEGRLREHAHHVLAVDDLANRRHDCDLLVDQNFSAAVQDRYHELLPAGCRSLLGPHFAMLRPEYRLGRPAARPRSGDVRRILIFFGGSDPLNLTGMAIDALCDPEFHELQVDVVVGVNNPHRPLLEEKAAGRPRLRLHGPQLHLADLMAEADLAIGAGGGTTWERMCVGLPSIVVSIAENQRPACESLAKAALIIYGGHHGAVQAADLTAALRRARADPELLAEISSRGQLMVDGWGSLRVIESMQPSARSSLRLRAANAGDLYQYFLWANDPDVRAQSLQVQTILLENHRKWFAAKLASPDSHLFVMQAGDLPVGQIRFDREGNEERIDYSIDKCFRGRGWAHQLAALGISRVSPRSGMVFRAEVKDSNLPSLAVFSRLGFSETSSQGGLRVFRFDPARHNLNGDAPCE